jgi:Spy/CpxP family protein refolding chaperone
MRKMLTRLLAVATVVTTVVLLAPTAASAADFEWNYVTSHDWRTGNGPYCQQNFNNTAQGCFFNNGDYLAIADINAD